MKAIIFLAAAFSLMLSSASVALAGKSGKKNNVPFYITSPTQGTVYKGGERVIIQWINGIHAPVKLRLLQGTSDDDMEVVTRHQVALDGDIGSYRWTVPTDLPSNDIYAFQFMYPVRTKSKKKGIEKFEVEYSYSGSFRILENTSNPSDTNDTNNTNNTIYMPTPSLTRGYVPATSSIHAIIPGYTHPSSPPATASRHDQLVPSPPPNAAIQQEGSASGHAVLSGITLLVSLFGAFFVSIVI
ncbi:hypothetical protein BX666DRAFT_1926066 [Dichotomocladium elegans]|nr:hypothetical protein BX666DRAFT_1926066 [Dichotomocladium elegans]